MAAGGRSRNPCVKNEDESFFTIDVVGEPDQVLWKKYRPRFPVPDRTLRSERQRKDKRYLPAVRSRTRFFDPEDVSPCNSEKERMWSRISPRGEWHVAGSVRCRNLRGNDQSDVCGSELEYDTWQPRRRRNVEFWSVEKEEDQKAESPRSWTNRDTSSVETFQTVDCVGEPDDWRANCQFIPVATTDESMQFEEQQWLDEQTDLFRENRDLETSKVKATSEILADSTLLTARTVDCILKDIKALEKKVDFLSQRMLEASRADSQRVPPVHPRTCFAKNVNFALPDDTVQLKSRQQHSVGFKKEERAVSPRRRTDRDASSFQHTKPRDLLPWEFDRRLFPVYRDGQDVIAFFSLYEQTCQDLGVPPRYYMLILRSQVTGALADLLGSLPPRAVGNYEVFKTLALQRFALCSESYRRAFRRVECKQENYYLTAAKLAQNLDRWLAAEGVKTFVQLKELILKEQFFELLPEDLAALVQDRDLDTLEHAAETAQRMRLHRQGENSKPASTDIVSPAEETTSPTVVERLSKEPRPVAECELLKAKEQKKISPPVVRTLQTTNTDLQTENWKGEAAVLQPAQVLAFAPSGNVAAMDSKPTNWAQMECGPRICMNSIRVCGLYEVPLNQLDSGKALKANFCPCQCREKDIANVPATESVSKQTVAIANCPPDSANLSELNGLNCSSRSVVAAVNLSPCHAEPSKLPHGDFVKKHLEMFALKNTGSDPSWVDCKDAESQDSLVSESTLKHQLYAVLEKPTFVSHPERKECNTFVPHLTCQLVTGTCNGLPVYIKCNPPNAV